jgi:hypothetical protein
MKIGLMIAQLADSEQELADELIRVGERHAADQDVFHLTKTLAKIEQGHIDALAPHAERYEIELERTVVEGGTRLSGPRPEPGLLLLRDLRGLHLLAAGASLLRTLKWTTYRLKEAAPQTLTS